jgi:hypothetical protein
VNTEPVRADLVVRLPPTFTTLRELFVHSGNQCAFPGCTRRLVNARAQWVGEVCHIEAAMPGGERFNAGMTNEERREAANLTLMCHEHHVETNDVAEFTVERLKEFKAQHEAAFAGSPAPLADDALAAAVKEIVESDIVDVTDRIVLRPPQTLIRFGEVLELDETPDMLRQDVGLIMPRLEALRRIPVDSRAIFGIVVDRASDYEDDLGVPADEVASATGIEFDALRPHVLTLERYGLAGFDENYDDYRNMSVLYIKTWAIDGWGFWSALKKFCELAQLEGKPLINQLRFDRLD